VADDQRNANVVLTADNQQYDRSMQQSQRATAQLLSSVVALSNGLNTLAQRAGKKMQLIGAGEIAALTAATASAARFEQQMSTLQANAVLTGKNFNDMTKQVNSLRSQFAITTDQAIALQQQLRQMGQTQGLDKVSASLLKLGAVTGESVGQLTTGLIGLQRQFGTMGSGYTEKFSSALATVSARSGVAASSILDFSNAIAPVAKVAGMSQKEVMGFSTAFVKAGQDGGQAATAFNKMLTDITRSVQYGSPELKAYSNLIGVSVDQFKQMPRSEAVIRIFEQISKQGPDAIKTLERFGLDGIRTYKALQGVASQGGIRQAFSDVNAGYNDTSTFNKAASQAMDGLNDQMQKLGNNLTMVGQAFGKAFVGPAQEVARAVNGIVAPIASLLQSLGNIPGVATAAGAAMLLMGGTVVRSLGVMSGLAAIRQINRGTTMSGFRIGRYGPGGASEEARRANETFEGGGGSFMQRATFAAGRRIGSAFPAGEGVSQGSGPGWRARARAMGNMAIEGLGGFSRMGIESLQGGFFRQGRYQNPMADTWYAGTRSTSSAMGEELGRALSSIGQLGKQGFGRLTGNSEMAAEAAARRANNAALNESSRQARANTGLFKTLGTETAKLAASMGRAAISSTGMVGSGIGRVAGKGLGMVGGMAMDFLGGPIGLGLAAGGAALSLYQQNKDFKAGTYGAARDAEATDAVGGAYRVALGEAARATTTFADIVKRNANSIDGPKEKAGVISDTMAAEAANPSRKYTDSRIANMSAAEARRYVTSTTMSDDERILLGYDLTKRFGRAGAQGILDAQSAQSGTINTQGIYSGLKGAGGFLWFGRDEAGANDATKMSTSTNQANLAAVEAQAGGGVAGQRAGAQYTINSLNAASRSYLGGGNQDQIKASIAGMLGITDPEKNQAFQRDFTNLFDPSRDMAADGTATVGPATVQTMIDRVKANPKMYSSGLATALQGLVSTVGGGADLTGTSYTPGQALGIAPSPFSAISSNTLSAVMGTQLGARVFSGNQFAGDLTNEAVGNQGNANLQQRAMKEMATQATTVAGNFSDASSSLQAFKQAIGYASDPLYQLAQNAQAVVAQRQQEAMVYMTRGQQAGQVAANFRAATRDAYNAQGTTGESDAEARLESSRQELESQRASAYQLFKQVVVQVREFNIAQSRAQEDFAIQRGRSDYEYNLQRSRAQEDFNRQRQRQEDQFNRSQARGLRDYNRGRMQAQQDFNKSRMRNEQDYQHQVVLMTEQAAQQVYNIYERVNVARTWSAQNLMTNAQDQLDRLKEQADNLASARKMGVSSDVIKLLGLNETQNAQQLARFVADLMADPSMVKSFNEMAKQRLAASKKIVTDQDNTQWQEMARQFKLNADRASEDFNTSMKRQAEGFAISLKDMRQDYNISVSQAEGDFARARDRQAADYSRSVSNMITDMGRQLARGRDDLNRSMEEITGTFDDLGKAAIKGLNGTAQKQMTALYNNLKTTATNVRNVSKTLASDVAHLFAQFGFDSGSTSGGVARSSGGGSSTHGGQTKYAAEGGFIDGYSPHKKADNIPARLTAGEYVHNVDAVNYYGRGFMDAINRKQIPKGEMGFASGGLVPFGRKLQSMDYQVSEHPLFGGVHPVHAKNSWHYKAGAIDVNHDQGDEKSAINKIISAARQYGLRVIWQVKDHFDHAHFDIGTGPDMIGPGVPTGNRASGDYDLLKAIKKLKSYQGWEKLRRNTALLSGIGSGRLAEVIADSFIPGGSGDVSSMAMPSSGNAAKNAALGRRMAAGRGWTGANWDALNWIWMHESGWNERADNPSSDAYGIPQALPGSKMATAGSDWRTNPATQIKWGLGYIAERYGNPVKAQQFWKGHNWYGSGAIFKNGAQSIGVGERGPEMVLPLNGTGADFLLAVMRQYSSAEAKRVTGVAKGVPQNASNYIYNTRIDKSTTIKEVNVTSQDPNDMLRKIEAKKRLDALTGAR